MPVTNPFRGELGGPRERMAVPKADFEDPTALVNAKQLKRSLIWSCRFKRHYRRIARPRSPVGCADCPAMNSGRRKRFLLFL
jgi:hypothetical protein